jgi:hypothetical protein
MKTTAYPQLSRRAGTMTYLRLHLLARLAHYATSRIVVVPSGSRRMRKARFLCLVTNEELDPSHDTSLSLRAVFGQEEFKPRTPLLAPFYPVGVVDYTPDQLTGLLRWTRSHRRGARRSRRVHRCRCWPSAPMQCRCGGALHLADSAAPAVPQASSGIQTPPQSVRSSRAMGSVRGVRERIFTGGED